MTNDRFCVSVARDGCHWISWTLLRMASIEYDWSAPEGEESHHFEPDYPFLYRALYLLQQCSRT